MDGTSERKPPERDRAHRHLHAVPQQDNDAGAEAAAGTEPDHGSRTDRGATAGSELDHGPRTETGGTAANEQDQGPGVDAAAGDASPAGPEPFPVPPAGRAPPAGSDSPQKARPAGGMPPANGTSPAAAGPSAAGPASAGPASAGLAAGPSAAGPRAAGPRAAGSNAAESSAAPAAEPRPLLLPPGRHILAATGFYAVLLVLGLLLGLTGAFQFSRGIGPVPLGAVLFVLAVGAVCWFCGRATRSVGGALVPAVGWIVASFSMAMPNTSGSVVITNSIAGEIYLYGGALCAAIGVGAAFGGWTRAQQASISGPGAGPRRPRP